jgi:hypothetical protein
MGKDRKSEKIYLIYAYEELTTHSVYVGLTKNLKNRDS